MAGILLLLAMIGAIALTIDVDARISSKYQSVSRFYSQITFGQSIVKTQDTKGNK